MFCREPQTQVYYSDGLYFCQTCLTKINYSKKHIDKTFRDVVNHSPVVTKKGEPWTNTR